MSWVAIFLLLVITDELLTITCTFRHLTLTMLTLKHVYMTAEISKTIKLKLAGVAFPL